jgi:chromosome segregation ATPase
VSEEKKMPTRDDEISRCLDQLASGELSFFDYLRRFSTQVRNADAMIRRLNVELRTARGELADAKLRLKEASERIEELEWQIDPHRPNESEEESAEEAA